MSENSAIQWTDHTFNPWIGCTKVSPGCLNCYAETLDTMRFSKTLGEGTKEAPVSHWGKGAPRHRTSESNWKQPLKWDKQAALTVGKGGIFGDVVSPRVFCASLADWLDDEVPIEWLADLLELIGLTPNLDWLLLTKRPQNWRNRLITASVRMLRDAGEPGDKYTEEGYSFVKHWLMGNPPSNIWMGTTVENQAMADERIPVLLDIPAKVRFLSCEPLLGPVKIDHIRIGDNQWFPLQHLHWVITGGESGPGARPMHPDWARSLRDQCKAANVPFFMKQLGGVRDHRGNLADFPDDLRVRQFPTNQN